MDIAFNRVNGVSLAELIPDRTVIRTLDDMLDLIGNCGYQGSERIIVYESSLPPEFFDLKTGLAGDMLQKFSTYQVRLAIIGDFSKYSSKSLQDFIRESNAYKRINFVASIEEARQILAGNGPVSEK